MNRKRFLAFLIIGCSINLFWGCGSSVKTKSEIIESWKLGTSVGSIEKLTEKKLDQLKSVGFTDIEVGIRRIKTKEDLDTLKFQIDRVKNLVEKKDINVWSIHIPYGRNIDISLLDKSQREKAIEEIILMMTTCKNLNPEKLVIHGSFEPVPNEERAERQMASILSLKLLTQKAAEYKTQLTIECLPRTCLGNTSTEILSILSKVDGLAVCCDVNHLLQETPEEFIETVGSSVVTLHISDYDYIDERHWLPGKGVINWNNVLESLISIGYNGPFMFESRGTFEEKAQCWEKLKQDYINSILSKRAD